MTMTTDAAVPQLAASIEADGFFEAVLDPAYVADPYPVLDRFRRSTGPSRIADHLWLVTRHEDAIAVLRSPHASSNERHGVLFSEALATRTDEAMPMLLRDAPDHTRLRGLVTRAFTPRTIEALRPRIEAIVDRRLDVLDGLGGEALDFIELFGYPIPVAVICELLGVPTEDAGRFAHWSSALVASLDPPILRTPEIDAAAALADAEIGAYLHDLFAARLLMPRDDLVSGLLAARRDGDALSDIELTQLVILLLVAGHETTVNLLGNALLALATRPPDWRALRDGRCGPHAIDELIRFDSPVQMTQRVVLQEHRLGDVVIPAHDHVIVMLGAANRDPLFAPSPHVLDLDRDARNHVGFGGGIHHCLGAALARTEAEIALRRLAARFAGLELAGAVEHRRTFVLRGPKRLPIRLTR